MRNTPSAILIFAAGFGTRMGALTRDRPKPLIEVSGKPLIDHALGVAADVPRKVVNAHYRAQQLEDYLSCRDVSVSVEVPDILDTGGGLRQASALLGEDTVYTLNSDAIWTAPNPLSTLGSAWNPSLMQALLLLVPISRAKGRSGPGDFSMAPDGRLSRGGDLVFTGAQILQTPRLADIPDRVFSLNRVWDLMERDGGLFGTVHSGGWCDVGHPAGITTAEAMLAGDGDG